ncbi:MAG: hypothetical protein QXW86_12985, partial [Saccharolobus sp.]|uniref:hypothetical protein n=1 Tax=Saccharolobus sp. TaxID=2100761 RepID=UPI00317FDF6E
MSASNSSSIKIWREIYERLANVLYRPATVNGVLNIEPSGRVLPEDAIKSNLEIKNILEEILSKNWKYIYIDVHGTYYIKTELTGTTCRLIPHTVSPRGDPESYAVYIHLGNKLPEITIKNLEEFSINVSTKNFPRAV